MPKVALIARATRAKMLPVLLVPVAVGSALAWREGVPRQWGWFALSLAGAGAMHLGANVLNDYFDERTGADKLARVDRTAIPTASGLLQSGAMTPRGMLGLAAGLFALALGAGMWLALARGFVVLALGAGGALLAFQYAAPPLRIGYRGRGLGEAAVFVAFGVLPVVGAYYVQAQRFSTDAFWASVVPGLLLTLVVYHHHFLHWRADKAVGKMTPVAVLEPEAALVVSGAAITLVYVVLTLQVAIGLFPAWSLAALITTAPLASSWARAMRDPVAQHVLNLLGATLGATVVTGIVLTVALSTAR